MKAYIYQAALLCEACANSTRVAFAGQIVKDGKLTPPVTDDSDKWPQGPYSDGGGEADCPQHCDHCGVFLENSLTFEGLDYVRHTAKQDKRCRREDSVALTTWVPFYGIVIDFSK